VWVSAFFEKARLNLRNSSGGLNLRQFESLSRRFSVSNFLIGRIRKSRTHPVSKFSVHSVVLATSVRKTPEIARIPA